MESSELVIILNQYLTSNLLNRVEGCFSELESESKKPANNLQVAMPQINFMYSELKQELSSLKVTKKKDELTVDELMHLFMIMGRTCKMVSEAEALLSFVKEQTIKKSINYI